MHHVADPVPEEGEREHCHHHADRGKRVAVSTTGGLLVPSHLLPTREFGGLMPTPMKDSAVSAKIASGMSKVIETTIEVRPLGSTWRGITR